MTSRTFTAPFCLSLLMLALLQPSSFAADEDAKAHTLRVMTYNIRYDNPGDKQNAWTHRKDWLAEIVKREQPDVAGFQEVEYEQLEDLKQRLPAMTAYGVGRDDGKRGGEFVPIMYRTERFEALDQGTFWLSTTPDKPGSKSWDTSITRCVSWLKLKDKNSGGTFFFLNTHFDHMGKVARAESARLVIARLQKEFAGLPVVLTGDFNTRTKSEPHNVLIGSKTPATEDTTEGATETPAKSPSESSPAEAKPQVLFRDTYDSSAEKPTGPDSTWNGFEKIAPGNRIDFVFVTPTIKVQKLAILDDQRDGRFPSDHLPIVTVLELPSP